MRTHKEFSGADEESDKDKFPRYFLHRPIVLGRNTNYSWIMVRVLAMVVLVLWAPLAAAGERLSGPYAAEALRVLDGDSIEARVTIWLGQQVVTTVRLAGIDTAELHAGCLAARTQAQAARMFLIARVEGRALTLTGIETDKYGGRIVAHVADEDGADLAAALLAAGLARAYAGRRPDWCAGSSQTSSR